MACQRCMRLRTKEMTVGRTGKASEVMEALREQRQHQAEHQGATPLGRFAFNPSLNEVRQTPERKTIQWLAVQPRLHEC
jgi:hypothetical protein